MTPNDRITVKKFYEYKVLNFNNDGTPGEIMPTKKETVAITEHEAAILNESAPQSKIFYSPKKLVKATDNAELEALRAENERLKAEADKAIAEAKNPVIPDSEVDEEVEKTVQKRTTGRGKK